MYEMIQREEIIKSYTFPTKPSSDGYYHVYVKDSTVKSGRRQFKSKTLEGLREKVYQYEKGTKGTVRKTFRDVFEIVQSQKLEYVKSKEKRLSVENTIICKCQYKNVGFIQNNYVGKPTFLFCIFSLRSSVRCCI